VTARRRLAFLGVLVGAASLVAGIVVAAFGLTASSGPAVVVRSYFAALARADAQQALAYGDLPAGPHELLTDKVLAEQIRIAPLRDVTVTATAQDGNSARVGVRYTMGFADGPITTSATMTLHRSSDEWRLDRAAIGAEIVPSTAAERLSVLGGTLPHARVLLFPGALPVRVDTSYLELVPAFDYVSFGSPSTLQPAVRVSEQGETAVRAAVRASLQRCLGGPPDPACPLPSERYVPGSVRGRIVVASDGLVDLDQNNPAGLLHYAGKPTISGHWRRLDYHNVARRQAGQVLLDVRASGYAVDPLRMHWTTA
jgi:hypothetical protein